MRRLLVLVAASVLVVGSCGGGDDEGGSSDSSVGVTTPTSMPVDCPDALAPTVGTVTVSPLGPAEFDSGVVHECLAIGNGSTDDIVVGAVQVLPAEGEEPFVVVEADDLDAVFGIERGEDAIVAAGSAVVLPVSAFAPEPPGMIRHRVAYSDLSPDGRRELFVEGAPVAVDDTTR